MKKILYKIQQFRPIYSCSALSHTQTNKSSLVNVRFALALLGVIFESTGKHFELESLQGFRLHGLRRQFEP